ncbi:MAG: hypothetical protein A2X94_16250 [Bdellovibrionales bacterium GWB1_55_8]|nr:MAG: hypothetical protein A2X94_16250 [Bdellovibrionales bacterium GWB1_55_8]
MTKKARPRALLKRLISWRRGFQIVFGLSLYLAISNWGISLWWVIAAGSALGIFLGKFFCRWMCPMGAIMEMMMGAGDEDGRKRSFYNYFKMGCPIAWAGGFLNRMSLFRVRVADASRCKSCNICDEACYVAQFAPGHSLHLKDLINPSTHFSCSRCLNCVKACPAGALTFQARL